MVAVAAGPSAAPRQGKIRSAGDGSGVGEEKIAGNEDGSEDREEKTAGNEDGSEGREEKIAGKEDGLDGVAEWGDSVALERRKYLDDMPPRAQACLSRRERTVETPPAGGEKSS